MIASVATPKAGLCPHGLPPSACPICSNMGGGGGKRTEISFKSNPPQMMSWNQCEAIGFFLKGLRRGTERRHENFKELALQLQIQANNFSKMASRLEQLNLVLNNLFFGPIISLQIKFIALPAVRILQTSFSKFADITDKIAAIIGEIKKGLEKARENINKFFKEIKNKLFRLFAIFSPHNDRGNDNQINEEKRIFNIKRYFKFLTKQSKQEENEAGIRY